MFVRKGTTLRKKRQSVRRPRRQSTPSSQADVEAGGDVSGNSQNLQTRSTAGSSASSTLTLDDEKTLVQSHYQTLQSKDYQHASTNYGSILYQVREAQDESIDLLDFLQRLSEMVWPSLTVTVFLLLLLGLPISMIAMGTSYLEECPVQPRLPIYLLVGGAFGFIHVCIVIWHQKRSRDYMLLDDSRDDDDEDNDDVMTRSYRFTGYILTIFFLIWFGFGNYWLFSIWKPNFEQPLHEPRNWCSRNLYHYAFYQMITWYSLFGAGLLVVIGLVIGFFCCGKRH